MVIKMKKIHHDQGHATIGVILRSADREDRDTCRAQTRKLSTRKPVPRRTVDDVPLVTIPAMICLVHENSNFNHLVHLHLCGSPYDSYEIQDYSTIQGELHHVTMQRI